MLQSYLSTALRAMLRNKSSTLISIGGLALGMCCALLIFLFIQFELSYDSFHKKQDLIYQVLVKGEQPNGEMQYRSSVVPELADRLTNDFLSGDSRAENGKKDFYPQQDRSELPASHFITDVVRMSPQTGHVRYGDRYFEEEYFYFTEAAVFRIFNFPLAKGNLDTALSEPGSIVLTPEMAEKYFPAEDPLGKTIRFELPSAPPFSFQVTGILQPIPENSSMRIRFLATLPFEFLKSTLPAWQPLYTYTYIEFGGVKRPRRPSLWKTILRDLIIWTKPINVNFVAHDFNEVLARIRLPDSYADRLYADWYFTTKAFRETYLARDRMYTSFAGNHVEPLKQGNLLSLLLLFVLGLLILTISCINVTNLSTARSACRAREIAVRKVMGADRGQLILQFLTESILLSFIALLLSLSLVELLLPGFNRIFHRELTIDYVNNWGYLLGAIAGIALVSGLLSGIYPAFFLSSFPVVDTMKGENLPASKKLRKWLITFQIIASVCVLIFTCFLSWESNFLRNKHPGFQTEGVVFFKIAHDGLQQVYPQLKKDLLDIAGISGVTASSLAAWEYGSSLLSSFSLPDTGETVQARLLLVDPDYLRLYGIPVREGEDFPQGSENLGNICIVNQVARKLFALEGKNIVGMKLRHGEKALEIRGVTEDFHFDYPWRKIEPLVILPADAFYGMQRPFVSVRLPGRADQVVEIIEKTARRSFPESTFSFRFVDREIDRIHRSLNSQWEKVLQCASAVLIFLAVLGLAGFAEYEAERKIKEIGIRRVLGATRMQICIAFVWQFVPMVLVANVVAWSLSVVSIPAFLRIIDYPWPFRVEFPGFILSCSLTFLICFATVGFQIFRAASVNPAEALRDE